MSKKEFGRLLKKLRLDRGLTQPQLVEKLQDQPHNIEIYTNTAVSKWEHGKTKPSADVVESLEDILQDQSSALTKAIGYEVNNDAPLAISPGDLQLLDKHYQSLREIASKLAKEIQFPQLKDLYVSETIDAGLYSKKTEENYPQHLLVWRVANDGIIELLCPVYNEPNQQEVMSDLLLHLNSSDFAKTAQKLELRKSIGGELFILFNKFISLIIKSVETNTGFDIAKQTIKKGCLLFDFYLLSIGITAIEGPGKVNEMSYTKEEFTEDIHSLWVDSKLVASLPLDEVDKYEEIHKKLIVEFGGHEIAVKIREMIPEISQLEKSISEDLKRFARKIPLPGHCEVCK